MIDEHRPMRFRFPDKPVEVTPDFVSPLSPEEWIIQGKYDGWRALIFIDGPRSIRIMSRHNTNLATTTSDDRKRIIERLRLEVQTLDLPPGTVLDSELVGPRGNHNWSLYLFDCLAWAGDWLCSIPFEQRWAKCNELGTKLSGCRNVFLAETIYGSSEQPHAFLEYFNRLKAQWEKNGRGMDLFEGIVLKRRTGMMKLHFNDSHKSNCMFKLKYRDIREARF